MKRVLFILLSTVFLTILAQKRDPDEDKAYEFGFKIDGQQHRQEKKSANGIIEGEFGFITADGIYHVTVYATDENGNFRILKMKNIRVSGPLDGSGPPLKKTSNHSAALIQAPQKNEIAPQNPVTLSTTTMRKMFTGFTTQPTIKPACAGCGYVTTKKPVPGEKFPYSRPQNSENLGNQPQNPLLQQNQILNQPQIDQRYPPLDQSTIPPIYTSPPPKEIKNEAFYTSPAPQSPQNPYQPPRISNPLIQNQNFPPTNILDQNSPPQNQNAGQLEEFNEIYPSSNSGEKIQNLEETRPNLEGPKPNQEESRSNLEDPRPNLEVPRPNLEDPRPNLEEPRPNLDGTRPNLEAPRLNSEKPSPNPKQPAFTGSQVETFDPNSPQNGQNQNLELENRYRQPENPIHVEGNVIKVPGNPDVEIKDKYQGMVDGLPEGITEGDISDILYRFNYTVGFHGHYETGYKNGAKVGGYFVNGRDGISRIVTYVADENGYRPKVRFTRLNLDSDDVPKEGSEKKFGLKNFEFIWHPLN